MASRDSADEGEILEGGANDLKATTLPTSYGRGVDPQDRTRDRHSRSPGSDRSRTYARSHRATSPRGYKRSRDDRDDRHNAIRGSNQDPRRYQLHYEDRDQPRKRHFYDDEEDYSTSRRDAGRHGEHERADDRASDTHNNRDYRPSDRGFPAKRPRTRSRSPGRSNGRDRRERGRREPTSFDRRVNRVQAESSQYSSHNNRAPRDDKSKRAPVAETNDGSEGVAKSGQGNERASAGSRDGHSQSIAQHQNTGTEPQEDWEEPQEVDIEAEIRRRQERRKRILERVEQKSRATTPLHIAAVHADSIGDSTTAVSSQPVTPPINDVTTPYTDAGSPAMSPGTGLHPATPEAFDLGDEQDIMNTFSKPQGRNEEDGPSAADYDPTADMKEDERRDELRHAHVGLHGEERTGSVAAAPETANASKANTKTGQDDAEDEDDGFDMFAEEFDEDKYVAPKSAGAIAANGGGPDQGGILEGDDKDGYYKIRPGEVLGGRYQIQSGLGKGMFSGVARALDMTTKKLVAIKIMRNNDALRKGGYTEIAILQKLNGADPDNKKFIVRFDRSFDYKGHLCMAFENLSMNLREVLKKFGNNVGINLGAVKNFAYQMFLALGHMRKCSIIHADIKPDNILVNDKRHQIKICDLGTAIDRSDAATAHNEITPYLVSRFYRAPEIILGIPYDYAADMWSIGCTLYELYTGKILFAGDSNNQMLKAIMEIRGKMSGKLYRRGQLWRMHFDEEGRFISQERDKVLGKAVTRILAVIKPTRDLRMRLMAASSDLNEDQTRELNLFSDLLDKCLNLNPDKRITPHDALRHPFFTTKTHSIARR